MRPMRFQIYIKLCKFISKKYGYNYKTLVPTNLYGPNDKYDLQKSHLLAAIIKKLSDAKKKKLKKLKYGEMVKQKRIYVCFDLSDAIWFQ